MNSSNVEGISIVFSSCFVVNAKEMSENDSDLIDEIIEVLLEYLVFCLFRAH